MSSNNHTTEGLPEILTVGFDDPRLKPFDHLVEPELSAYLRCAGRIAAARTALLAAEETWAILSPVIASRYALEDADQIDAEGRIHRANAGREPAD